MGWYFDWSRLSLASPPMSPNVLTALSTPLFTARCESLLASVPESTATTAWRNPIASWFFSVFRILFSTNVALLGSRTYVSV